MQIPSSRRLLPALLTAGLLGLPLAACESDDGTAGEDTSSPTPDTAEEPDTSEADDASDAADGPADVGDAGDVLGPPPERVAEPRAPEGWSTAPQRVPRNVHMTWQRDPSTTMTFTWTTTDITLDGYVPRVWVAPADQVEGEGADAVMPWRDAWVFEGEGMTYRESLLGREVGDTTYVVWEVEVTGLDPETAYAWRVGTWEFFDPYTGTFTAPTLSEPQTFRTGVAKGDREPFHFMMAGDSRGGTEEIKANIDRLAAMEADLWFFNGDMTQGGTQPEWDTWFDAMAPLHDKKVLMPVQGNHEIFQNLYYNQYGLPRDPGLSEHLVEHAWTLDYGNVHFVGLDSNNLPAIQDQKAWLDADLAAARKDADIDFIVVMFHHAVYSASNHGSSPSLQEHWEPIFEAHDVDLVFTGHDHDYERTHAIREGAVAEDGDGVVYVVAGGFYSPGYGNGDEWWTVTSTHGDEGNYAQVAVDGPSLTVTAYSGDGSQVLDEFTLTAE